MSLIFKRIKQIGKKNTKIPMTLMLAMHNGTSMIKNCKTYIYFSQKLIKWYYLMYISIQRIICPQINLEKIKYTLN